MSTEPTWQVIKRTGDLAPFTPEKIRIAVSKAFIATLGNSAEVSSRVRAQSQKITEAVTGALKRRLPDGGRIHIEDIQDQVELALMRSGEHAVARAYVLYREAHARQRTEAARTQGAPEKPVIHITGADGQRRPLDRQRLEAMLDEALEGLQDVSAGPVLEGIERSLFDGMTEKDLADAVILSARNLIDREPDYTYVAARLLLDKLRHEALTRLWQEPIHLTQTQLVEQYGDTLARTLQVGAELGLLDPELTRFDLKQLGAALKPERDFRFTYLGLQTLYDRYFIHDHGTRIELPQIFFMRVAMGLAINEVERERRAIEFYELLSSFDFMSSTPTLFNSGTLRPQLSSCYLTTVPDDLEGIFNSIRDDALLSKFAGGLGNDWTRVRGMGAHIRGTNGTSQGVVPFLKVANDTAVAVNQGGKRKGAMCAYLETWHIDIEDFLELRKNTGDDRRRTHDMNTANWVPDLFMERVVENGEWTLFSPDEVPELHDLYGRAFREKYEAYEAAADRGEIRVWRRVKAQDLWRRMLGMLFETGHPWITFKDPCNIRSPQRHCGVVHSSNLCTEITLNTSDDEIAVCNLGSINLARHVNESGLDMAKLERTVRTAMRMLDNVIDYNFYAVPQARRANLRHRPVGLGIMGFQDALYALRIPYASEEAVEFADHSMEAISWFAIRASTDLAEERGPYPSFEGSLWSQGILPIDSIRLLAEERGNYLAMDTSSHLDWDSLRERVRKVGMRNSNCMAIAPTATISNICGVSQSIEPTYQNLYVKSNLSGEFTVVNPWLARDLKARGLWDDVMVNDIKYYDGSVQQVERVPEDLRALYQTAFEMDTRWLIEAASRRQKWLDQAQSLNLYLAEPSGKKLDALYTLAWVRGLKTTYYLRSLGATAMEKHADDRDTLSTPVPDAPAAEPEPKVCSILDPDCEACQ